VELSDSNQDGQDDPAGDDTGGQGAPSAKPTASNLIRSSMSEQVHPSVADQFTPAAPLGSGQPKRKHLVLVSKHKQHAPSDQVRTEFLPHHVPQSPMGLVAVKLVFERLFEAFQCPSQAARTDTSAGADAQPGKRLQAPLMRRMLMRQVCDDLDSYFIVCEFILYSDDSSICRKPSSADPLKKITKPATSSYATPVAPSVGVTSSTTSSVAEPWDYCWQTAEFLEGFKNREADQEGNPFTPSLFLSFDLFG
jgi:hypothetical protein